MALIRMKTHHIKKGMVIKADVYNRAGVILVPADTTVTSEVFELLTKHFIEEVVIEYVTEPAPVTDFISGRRRISEKKLKEAARVYKVAENTLAQNLKDIVEKDKEVDIPTLLGLLQSVINKADEELSILDILHHMQQDANTLYSHSINVSLYAQLLARWIDLDTEEIEIVSLAGLLHDMGHMQYPESDITPFTLHDGMDKLCHEQHPTLGYRLLQHKANVDHRIKQAVLTHHERFDESGFPLKISFVNINEITRILSIADSYVTLITEEQGHPALTPFEALRLLQETDYKKYDYRLLTTFVEHVSLNYVQHEVQLTDGRIGTILMINKADISRPLIQIGNLFVDLTKQKEISIEKILL